MKDGQSPELETMDGQPSKLEGKGKPEKAKGGRGKKTHVVHQGDKVREPTEAEVISREAAPEQINQTPGDANDRAREVLDSISRLRSSEARWKSLSAFQRYFLTGVETLAKELLGERDANGKLSSVSGTLGFNIAS